MYTWDMEKKVVNSNPKSENFCCLISWIGLVLSSKMGICWNILHMLQ